MQTTNKMSKSNLIIMPIAERDQVVVVTGRTARGGAGGGGGPRSVAPRTAVRPQAPGRRQAQEPAAACR